MDLIDYKAAMTAEQVADNKLILSEGIAEKVIVVPSGIVYPDIRQAYETGTFAKDDTIIINVRIFDAAGKEKIIKNTNFELNLKEYVKDPTKEVLGVLYFNFVENYIEPPAEEVVEES